MEHWAETNIGKIATVSSGGTPSRSKAEYWGGSIPWVTTGAINFDVITEPSEMITEVGLKNSSARIFPQNTILMAMYGQGATRGRVALLGFPAAINQACAAPQVGTSVLPKLLFFQLASRYEEIRGIGHGGNQTNLNAALIRAIKIHLPPLPEQRRIVEILDEADAAVRTTEALIVAKLKYKRAWAERLCPVYVLRCYEVHPGAE